jgi:hypothetical protein
LAEWNTFYALWNRLLPKNLRSFNKSNLARIGGAHAANRKRNRSVTAHTKAQALRQRKLKSTKSEPSRGAVANIRRMAHSAMAAMLD